MTNQAQGKPWDGHTELPWKVRTDDFGCAILTHDGSTLIAETSDNEARDKANAALIVECVNKGPAADEMAEALERAIELLWEHCEGIAPRIEPLEEALAAYRGEQP